MLFVCYENWLFGEKKWFVGEVVLFGCMGVLGDLMGVVLFFVLVDVDYIIV